MFIAPPDQSKRRIRRLIRTLAAFACLSAIIPASSLAQENEQNTAKGDRAPAATASLPNGATSINETYGDWVVNCAIADDRKSCVFSQDQGNKQTGQRLFGIELQPATTDGVTNGVLLLPFGLKLDDGVKLKIDEQALGQGARFSTCVPAGCIVPVSFPKVATDAMRKGEKLVVTANRNDTGEPSVFNVSLNGFTSAMNRAAELAR